MITRSQTLVLMAISWTSSLVIAIGVLSWHWDPILIFVVPFCGTMPLVALFAWLNEGGRTHVRAVWSRLRHRHVAQ